jgi:hypothetical protein
MLRLRGGAGRSGDGGMLGRGPMAVDSDAGGGRAVGGGEKRVFVMGGFVIGFGHSMLTDVVESYNLDKGGWRKEPNLPMATSGSCAETMGGNIYMMGGHDERFLSDARTNISAPLTPVDCVWPTLDSVWRLDTGREQWVKGPSMLDRRTCFGSASVDGRIYVGGGFNGEEFVRYGREGRRARARERASERENYMHTYINTYMHTYILHTRMEM